MSNVERRGLFIEFDRPAFDVLVHAAPFLGHFSLQRFEQVTGLNAAPLTLGNKGAGEQGRFDLGRRDGHLFR